MKTANCDQKLLEAVKKCSEVKSTVFVSEME